MILDRLVDKIRQYWKLILRTAAGELGVANYSRRDDGSAHIISGWVATAKRNGRTKKKVLMILEI